MPALVAVVPHQHLFAAIGKRPRLALALQGDTLIDAATHREWVGNFGPRPAYARIAHLLCEIWFRLKSVGLAHDYAFDLPLPRRRDRTDGESDADYASLH